MWSGYAILTLLLFRLLWGLFGSSTARFASFVRGPAAVLGYLRDSKGWRAVGHTPLGALSVGMSPSEVLKRQRAEQQIVFAAQTLMAM